MNFSGWILSSNKAKDWAWFLTSSRIAGEGLVPTPGRMMTPSTVSTRILFATSLTKFFRSISANLDSSLFTTESGPGSSSLSVLSEPSSTLTLFLKSSPAPMNRLEVVSLGYLRAKIEFVHTYVCLLITLSYQIQKKNH